MSIEVELSKANINENLSVIKKELYENVEVENCVETISGSSIPKKSKSNYKVSSYKKSFCYNKNMKLPHSKKTSFRDSSHLTNTSANIVLTERNVEIKDLESKVKFLKNKMKALEIENKTLRIVQSRQERELKKFKEGVTDIPALLKSHKQEIKVYESTIFSIRKELKDCQKELKLRNENLLKNENQIDKLHVSLKQNEKLVHEFSSEIKLLKVTKENLEKENNVLVLANENLKNKNDDLCKQIKDMVVKIQNLEDLNNKCDLNENLKFELNEPKGKHKNELLQVSTEEIIQDCAGQIHFETDLSSNTLVKNSSLDCLENEMKNLKTSVVDDTDEKNLFNVKSVDRNKNTLVHAFKCYQQFCNSQLENSSDGLFGTGMSNIKMLPPIKEHSKESSTSVVSAFGKNECFSSTNTNFPDRMKYFQNDTLSRDFKNKFNIFDRERGIDKNKSIISHNSTIKERNNVLDLSLNNDESENWQNCEFKKNDQFAYETNINNTKRSQNNSLLVNDTIEVKKLGGLSEALKFHDYLCKNAKENTQNILESNNTQKKNIKREKYSIFLESSKNPSKYFENTVDRNYVKLESNLHKDKACNSNHRTFLEKNLKPIICQFDELSEQKPAKSQSELSWWEKW